MWRYHFTSEVAIWISLPHLKFQTLRLRDHTLIPRNPPPNILRIFARLFILQHLFHIYLLHQCLLLLPFPPLPQAVTQNTNCRQYKNENDYVQGNLIFITVSRLITRPRLNYFHPAISVIVKMLLKFTMMTAIVIYALLVGLAELHIISNITHRSTRFRIKLLTIFAIYSILIGWLGLPLLQKLPRRFIRRIHSINVLIFVLIVCH